MQTVVTPERVAKRLADLPAAMPELQLLVLFGSAVKGRVGARSHIDLAIQCDGPADTAKLRDARRRATRVFLEREGPA